MSEIIEKMPSNEWLLAVSGNSTRRGGLVDLLDAPHNLVAVGDFGEALKELGSRPVAVLILDEPVEGKSGMEMLKTIRRFGLNPWVILLSDADPGPDDRLLDHLPHDYEGARLARSVARGMALARREAEGSQLRQRLRAVDGFVREAVVHLDADLTVKSINQGAKAICGVSRDWVGQPFDSLPAACIDKLGKRLREAMESMQPIQELEVTCPDADGRAMVVQVSIAPVSDPLGNATGAVLVVRDRRLTGNVEDPMGGGGRSRFHRMIGGSPAMQEVYRTVEELADMEVTTLITGESGTGKELVAEALHYQGKRAKFPLVKVNCAALPETLLESELFGHVKGAFTGAVKDRAGRFQMADKGTIFLDEIGDISPNMQARLLRILQESELERVGDSETVKVDVRIVTATNRDLADKVAKGSFREDLYYRLNVVEIRMPPLRERRGDIPLLAEHFLHKFNAKHRRNIQGFSEKALEALVNHGWPGNVRELEHVVEHAFVKRPQGQIKAKHLPDNLLTNGDICPLMPAMTDDPEEAGERDAILTALDATHWKKNKTAKLLGISRSSLYRKLEKLGIK